jgi:rod shape-determining protein MreD
MNLRNLIAFPVLGIVVMLQIAIVSRLQLLSGSADLVLLVLAAWALQGRVSTAWEWGVLGGLLVGFVSGLPVFIPLIGYLLVVGMARLVQSRIWQTPLLAMFVVTFAGTIVIHVISLFTLRLAGDPLPVEDAFSLITLPSVLLNLLLAVPVYSMVRDFASWIYPVENET